MLKGDQEIIRRLDLEGGEEEQQVTWGRVMGRTTEGYIIET